MSGRSLLPGFIKPVPATSTSLISPFANTTTDRLQPQASSFTTGLLSTGGMINPMMVRSGMLHLQTPGLNAAPTDLPTASTSAFPPLATVSQQGMENNEAVIAADGSVPEQLFPPGKIADLEATLAKSTDKSFIGLEYVIEIQHNTVKKMPHCYCCLLCDHTIRLSKDSDPTLPIASIHVRSTGHKLNYLKKHFPRIKDFLIGDKKPVDHITVNNIICQIVPKFGSMKVKIVVGQKLFKKKQSEIKDIIEKSSHFTETDELVLQLCGQLPSKSKTTRIDEFDDAFNQLEKDEISKKSTNQGSKLLNSAKKRNLDEVQVVGSNPIFGNEYRKRSSKSPIKSKTRSRSRHRDPSPSSPPSRHHRSSHRRSRSPRHGGHSRRRSRSPRDRRHRRSRSRSPRSSGRRSSPVSSRDRDYRGGSRNKNVRPSKSPPMKSAAPVRAPVSQPTKSKEELQMETDAKIKVFMNEDTNFYDQLEEEKNRFLENPEMHDDYTDEWRRFYNDKCATMGERINPSLLKAEWKAEWENILIKIYGHKLTKRRTEIMKKLNITKDDVEDFLRRKKVEQAQAAAAAERPSTSTATPHQSSDVGILNTLRYLAAIEHLLDDFRIQVIESLGRANLMESSEGSCVKLLSNPDFYNLMLNIRKVLQSKLEEAVIPEKTLHVVRICLDKITMLLQQSPVGSNTKEEDVQFRNIIMQSVRYEQIKAGKIISDAELFALASAECDTVARLRQNYVDSSSATNHESNPILVTTGKDGPRITRSKSPQPVAANPSPPPEQQQDNADNLMDDDYDDLTIDELVSLYQNFVELDKETQEQLIGYMKKLESSNPSKVLEIRKRIN